MPPIPPPPFWVPAGGAAGTYSTPFLTFGSTNASILTVPTASKKFGRSGEARELPDLEEAEGRKLRYDPFAEEDGMALGCSALYEVAAFAPPPAEEEEKFRSVLRGAGRRGEVLLRFRWWREVVM